MEKIQSDKMEKIQYRVLSPEWANHATLCSWILLTVTQMRVFANSSTSYETTPETLANNHHSLWGCCRFIIMGRQVVVYQQSSNQVARP